MGDFMQAFSWKLLKIGLLRKILCFIDKLLKHQLDFVQAAYKKRCENFNGILSQLFEKVTRERGSFTDLVKVFLRRTHTQRVVAAAANEPLLSLRWCARN